MSDLPEESGFEMVQGYDHWLKAPQVSNLTARLKEEFPEAGVLELRNHILNYTLIKLIVWMVPPTDEGEKKEPWEL